MEKENFDCKVNKILKLGAYPKKEKDTSLQRLFCLRGKTSELEIKVYKNLYEIRIGDLKQHNCVSFSEGHTVGDITTIYLNDIHNNIVGVFERLNRNTENSNAKN